MMMKGTAAALVLLSELHGRNGYSHWNWLGRGRLNVLQPNPPVLPHAMPCPVTTLLQRPA